MKSIVPTFVASNVRLALVFGSLAIMSPAWSLGHWGYCTATVEGRQIVHYYSEVSVIHATDSKDMERKFEEFMKETYTKDGGFVTGPTCFIDFDTSNEAETFRTERMAIYKDAVSVMFVYVGR